jgi:phosphoribosyl-ATP pyrophosphohydrolase
MTGGEGPSAGALDRLHAALAVRAGGDPAASYTAKLVASGRERIARKLGEEAVETVIEAVAGNRDGVVRESADLLYHLLVLWIAAGVDPQEVWAELARREGTSGLEEKRNRGRADDDAG